MGLGLSVVDTRVKRVEESWNEGEERPSFH